MNPHRVRNDRQHRLNFPRAFHNRLPGYSPTPLLDMADLARELGIGRLWVKDESNRLGARSYEVLGASWALYREVLRRLGRRPAKWENLGELRERIAGVGALRIVVVSDNNFAIGVARAAAWLGFECVAYMPAAASAERIAAVGREGAFVDTSGVTYDDALAAAATELSENTVVLSDSSWEGFDEIPMWVTEGYGTVFEETDDELERRGAAPVDAVVLPMGTGALAAAAGNYYRVEPGMTATGEVRRVAPGLWLLGAEPEAAPCFLESAASGRRTSLPSAAPSVMESLSRGLPSPLAWDVIRPTFDAFVAVPDGAVRASVARLSAHGISVSPSGAAAFAGLVEVLHAGRDDWSVPLNGASSVLVVCTEGPL